LGIYGVVKVSGLTVSGCRNEIIVLLENRVKDFEPKSLSVDMASYNGRVYKALQEINRLKVEVEAKRVQLLEVETLLHRAQGQLDEAERVSRWAGSRLDVRKER